MQECNKAKGVDTAWEAMRWHENVSSGSKGTRSKKPMWEYDKSKG